MDTMSLLVGVVLMLLGATYGEFWIVIGIAAIVVLTDRTLGTLVLMGFSLFLIYGLKDVVQDYIPYILLGMIILGMLFAKQPEPQAGMGMGGLEGLYGPPGQY